MNWVLTPFEAWLQVILWSGAAGLIWTVAIIGTIRHWEKGGA